METQSPLVAVVILNYNGKGYLEKFLPSVMATTYKPLRIIVADNASTDDSIPFLKKNYPEIELLEMKENTGFAGGYNEALKQVDTPYYVLLNSDVEVTPGWIEPIIQLMEGNDTIAACQPKILLHADKTLFEHAGGAGGWMDALGYPFCRGRLFSVLEKDTGQYDDIDDVAWASGAAMFVRSKIYHHLSGLDDDFFAHMEEIELCWRMRRAGFRIKVVPTSVVYHVGGGTLPATNPRKTYLNFRNNLVTLLKNEKKRKLFWLFPLRLVMDGLAALLFLQQGRWKDIWAIVHAHWFVFFNFPGIIKKRLATNDDIKRVSIFKPNKRGVLNQSLVWQFYIKRKKYFQELEF